MKRGLFLKSTVSFEKAMYYWNTGYPQQAKKYFNNLLENAAQMTTQQLYQTARFYKQIKEYKTADRVIEKAINTNLNLHKTAKLCLEIMEKKPNQSRLDQLLKKRELRKYPDLNLKMGQLYYQINCTEKAYYLLVKVIDQLEKNNDYNSPLYLPALLLTVLLEYESGNYNQARFQLRKTFYLQIDKIKQETIEKIVYWSLLLDEIDSLYNSKNYEVIIQEIENSRLKVLVDAYLSILENRVEEKEIKIVGQLNPKDNLLFLKTKTIYSYLIYLNQAVQGQGQMVNSLKKEIIKHKKPEVDLLYDLLNYQLQNQPDTADFFSDKIKLYADKLDLIQSLLKEEIHYNKKPDKPSLEVTILGGGDEIGGSSILL